jgi:hypothetical protein
MNKPGKPWAVAAREGRYPVQGYPSHRIQVKITHSP